MKTPIFLLSASAGLLLASCSIIKPYHMDIPQGTVLTDQKVAKIQNNMTKQEVINLLGEPQLTNAFPQDNRLDYVYTLQKSGGVINETRLTVIFDSNKVVKVIKESYPEEAKP